ARPARYQVRMARGVPLHGRPRRDVAHHLGRDRASAVPAGPAADHVESEVAELPRAPRLGADVLVRAAGDLARSATDDPRAVPERPAASDTGAGERHLVDSPAHLGPWILFLGLGR